MQTFPDKDTGRTTAGFTTLFGSRVPMWFSTKQPQFCLSKSVSTETETSAVHHYHAKLSESQYQEQDSSSSLSSEQSHHEADNSARSSFHMQNVRFQPGFLETNKKGREDCLRPFPPYENADYISHQVQMEHHQSLGCISYPLAGSFFGKIEAAYEPNALVYPQMIGVAPSRVVLPLDCTEGLPIFVNSKQYHAILRRRQIRAKLEAQNKLAKSKKPYLHESRHRHALKRARGSGGRFLNTKNTQQPKPSTQTNQNSISLQKISKDTPIASGSDVSCIFNNDDIFQQPDLRVSISSLTMGPTGYTGARSRVMRPDDRHLLSIDRCAQISTVT